MVIRMRTAVGVAAIWLATVACVSATAWVAIDRAGRDLTGGVASSLPPVTMGSALVTTTPQISPSRTNVTPAPSDTLEPSETPEPSAKPAPPATAKPSTTSRDRTFSLAGGQVSVRCTESTIRLRIAQPANGWRVEVEKAGPEEVNVNFRRGDSEDLGGSRLTAVCKAGTATIQAETEN